MTLTILKSSGQVFCKMSLNWDLSDDFLIVGPGDVFGEGGRRGEVAASSLLSRVDTGNILYWRGKIFYLIIKIIKYLKLK